MSFIDDFRQSVTNGLTAENKFLPCRFFYDELGSKLFSDITFLDEYYPTRAEKEILRNYGNDISGALPKGLSVVELGSGTSEKTPLLLSALKSPSDYVPVDIDDVTLAEAAHRLQVIFPGLKVTPVHADFTKPFHIPETVAHPVLGFFPGSTLGNFRVDEAATFLTDLAESLETGAYLLLGVDLVKDRETLELAYDDTSGVTAAFNKNILRRINRELDGNFDLDTFVHRAIWNPEQSAVQMFLESTKDQVITISQQSFEFAAGERIHTEDSHKYRMEELQHLANSSGWQWCQAWTDSNNFYSMNLLHRQ